MRVYNCRCRRCKHLKERRWVQRYKPNGYHAIGMVHAYAYCEKHGERVSKIKECEVQ